MLLSLMLRCVSFRSFLISVGKYEILLLFKFSTFKCSQYLIDVGRAPAHYTKTFGLVLALDVNRALLNTANF